MVPKVAAREPVVESTLSHAVGIFYYLGTSAVNQAQYVALQIYNVAVLRSIEVHHRRPVLGVIEEMQIVTPWVRWKMFLPCRV